MAKRFVRISLATKLRLLFGVSVIGIIAVALVVPWYFMELLAEQALQRPADELTRLRLAEWARYHPEQDPRAADADSEVVALYTAGSDTPGLRGPSVVLTSADPSVDQLADPVHRQAMRAFRRNPNQKLVVIKEQTEQFGPVYRALRAVRVDSTCIRCHDASRPVELQFQPGQLVGMIDVSLGDLPASDVLVIGTRIAFIAGGVLAVLAGFFLFPVITRKVILKPVGELRDMADRVAEGELSVRSSIDTGDELQRLGDSYNEMLEAINEQTDKLRSANRALDIKLGELAEANVTLHRANQVKTEFLTNVSHELRTPLNSIIGFADLLAEAKDERVRRYGGNICVAAKNLLNMINDLLDLAKIEAGKAQVRFDRVSVTDTCQTLQALIKPLADKKQIELAVEMEEDLPMIVTDGGKLQQILYNLLSNAIKFTPVGGRVTLSASRSPGRSAQAGETLTLSVADTGPGVPEADQQHIFEKFYQGDRTLTREAGGTGLGLAISRELTQLLGGRLTLESEPGHGATFTVHLPLAPPDLKEA
jgi:signal transduction histidine kinase